MPTEFLAKKREEIDTPALLVDLERFESNIRRLSGICRENGIQWRPHSKSHKSPEIAQLLLNAGASGITCAKLSEAELMAAHGIGDILVANSIVTPVKLQRLVAVQSRARVLSTIDSATVLERMEDAALSAEATIPLLIDLNIGMERTGVQPGQPALELARAIESRRGLQLCGITGYEGHVIDIERQDEKIRQCQAALGHLIDTRDLLEANGIAVGIVSAGGTGCYDITAAHPGITELQAGEGIFMDNLYRDSCNILDLEPALTVLSTVTSKQNRHIVTDAGFKTMSSYHQAPTPARRNDLNLRYLSAEHGIWDLKDEAAGPEIGEQIEFVVGYGDSTNFLHERFLGLRNGIVEVVWEILGRGKLS